MEKDYLKSKKYTDDELDSLQIPYKFRDFCQDDYADYLGCMRLHPKIIENKILHSLPLSQYYTSCQIFRAQWLKCEQYRQKQIFEELRNIFQSQKQ